MRLLYQIGDVSFFVFHVALIFFNVLGWIPRRWRKYNLITLGLTAFSWVILGIFYGFGYCFLTDWHWDIREALGYPVDSNSYIHFLVTAPTGWSIDEALVDRVTVVVFVLALAASVTLNFRDRKRNA